MYRSINAKWFSQPKHQQIILKIGLIKKKKEERNTGEITLSSIRFFNTFCKFYVAIVLTDVFHSIVACDTRECLRNVGKKYDKQ